VQAGEESYGLPSAIIDLCADVIMINGTDGGTGGNEPVDGMLDIEKAAFPLRGLECQDWGTRTAVDIANM
jgi:hypothetical protein